MALDLLSREGRWADEAALLDIAIHADGGKARGKALHKR
jgi:hypothetical protein